MSPVGRHDLISLAERCERASGRDANLGRELLLACGWGKTARGYFLGPLFHWSPPKPSHHRAGFDDDDFHRHDPTHSLDAAMALMDPRALWTIGSMEDGPFARLCWPMPGGTYVGGYVEVSAATAPLALAAACLRARARDRDSDAPTPSPISHPGTPIP